MADDTWNGYVRRAVEALQQRKSLQTQARARPRPRGINALMGDAIPEKHLAELREVIPEKDEKAIRAEYFREAARAARYADDALDAMNKEKSLKDMRIGFDLSYLAELFDNHAEALEGKANE